MIARGILSARHPVLAHLIAIRRCNLSCAYCNEYDKISKPIPLEVMFRRIDRLAALGTTIITISGGEPLLHPELEEIVHRIRQRGILAGLITNGYLLTPQRIDHLNRAGLDHLQISIDNVLPDDVSKKSLRVLDRKLRLLARDAIFQVSINYICEDGLVHYCSQQRGYPAIPLEKYTRAHLEHEYHTQKSCAPRCTISCVQQVAMLDNWRDPQTRPAFQPTGALVQLPTPSEW
jgi:pyruvate-formate lyase-activating enzyme